MKDSNLLISNINESCLNAEMPARFANRTEISGIWSRSDQWIRQESPVPTVNRDKPGNHGVFFLKL